MSIHVIYDNTNNILPSNQLLQPNDFFAQIRDHDKLYEFKAWQQIDILADEKLPNYNAVCIKLCIRDVIRLYFLCQDGRTYFLDRDDPPIEKTLWIPDFTLMSNYAALQYIGHVLPCPRIPDNVRAKVAYDISCFAQSVTTLKFDSVGTIRPFVLDVAIVDLEFYGDLEAITWATSESIEVQEFKPVPSTKSSIEALEKTRYRGSSSTQECMICLEKLIVGSKVIYMPCNHVYHENCIIRWLETSHFCPLCRFPMPH